MLFVLLLMCAGIIGFGVYTVRQFEQMVAREMEAAGEEDLSEVALREAIADDETLRQQIGEIRDIRYDLTKTMEATGADDSYFWYIVQGTEGTASVRTVESDQPEQWFDSIELLTPDGELVALEVDSVPYFETLGELKVIRGIEQDPALQPLIGKVHALRTDYDRTDAETDPQEPVYWYHAVGDAGELPVVIRFVDSDDEWLERVEHAEAELPDGTRHEIIPASDETNEPPADDA